MILGRHFEIENNKLCGKFKYAGYPVAFTNSVIRSFENSDKDDLLISFWLFKEELPKVRIQLPYCLKNESMYF